MARVNIEDKLYRDLRWSNLLLKCGNRYTALGMLTTAWSLASSNWLEHGFIPEKAWPKDLDVLIEVELALRVDGGVYVKGSKRAFKWLQQKSDAGKHSAIAKAHIKEMDSTDVDVRSTAFNGSQPLTLTPSLPLTHTLKENNTITAVASKEAPTEKALAKALFLPNNEQELIAGLSHEVKKRWEALYPDQTFIHREVLKAFGWCANNPQRKPRIRKGWVRFLSHWFEKSWPQYQKTIKASSTQNMSEAEMMAVLEGKI